MPAQRHQHGAALCELIAGTSAPLYPPAPVCMLEGIHLPAEEDTGGDPRDCTVGHRACTQQSLSHHELYPNEHHRWMNQATKSGVSSMAIKAAAQGMALV